MPKVRPDPEAEFLRDLLAARDDFERGFKRSKKGNLWRNWRGMTLTVFRRQDDDTFGWCVADAEQKRFSPKGYEDEGEALSALWHVTEGKDLQ